MDFACSSCNEMNLDSSNFCKNCGSKLHDICLCWVKKKAYNCGLSDCPGYRLFSQEKLQSD